ncbi:SOS response-associated peptidase family protein [Methylophilus sp.]|uniref:SOS response-associated peptidase n=1 Tax=Methylophilus sp. TaxID=29541 RepID=UPI0025808783|nr:SOS response-associated peptidase family protein [Methylophilus sp.]
MYIGVMCSNFQPIKNHRADWVKHHFCCDLPAAEWRPETYPNYQAPFIYLRDGQPACDLAQFGLVPHWAADKKKFGLRTYNARTETVHEKPTYRVAWRERRFGLVLCEKFYEPCYETGKAVRTGIYRADGEPTAIASIWERFIDKDTGEVLFSFSMLTVNADNHPLMKRFHKPGDEKRSVVVVENQDMNTWLHADHDQVRALIKLSKDGYLVA